ncbi:MAG: asparagine synthase (glutamine-hydrolyzing) [Nitrospirales bacterium]|nr:asparagine synthase (glutamine-hydrolyzing) [Nitrospira sp.]MDR4501934.1 asparagine synthase (glutamine-hydrolyzing) [Nitrospirales bacterium]
MCGIYGILNFSEHQIGQPDVLDRMGKVMVHRGPDDHGEYVGPGILLGMRRLAIIDVAGGHQPIANETNTLWTVCNGEIYNFRELRETLSRQGHTFSSKSDSEVVVHAYEQYGDEFITCLDGMYGFALWDTARRRLLVGRDRLGIKPLYYYNDGFRLVFASEVKSILAVPGVSAELDPAALQEYLTLGYTPAPYSMFRGIQKLPPASMLIWENGRCEIRSYWQFPDSDAIDHSMDEQEWAEAVVEAFEAAVVSQMVSDVPLGAFLSGGIDSSSVVALMAKNSRQPVKTYSIGFEDSEGGQYYNELPYARRIAELFGTDHKEILVRPDVASLLPHLLWHMDEPMADAAFITTYLVAEFARRDVTVILSGVGGDELFGGYRRYLGEYYGQYYNRVPQWLRHHVLTPLARALPSDRHSPLLNLSRYARSFMLSNQLSFAERYRTYVQVFNHAQRSRLLQQPGSSDMDTLGTVLAGSKSGDALRRLLQVDLSTQLPDDLLLLTDKMTMAVSLECRVPILDQRLVELSARMPSRYKIHGRHLKHILKVAFKGILPDDILHRKKRGFGAPMGAWVKGALSPLLKSVLSKESIQRRGVFDWNEVEQTIALHEANKEDHTDHLLALMNFEIWSRMYLDGQQPEEVAAQLHMS